MLDRHVGLNPKYNNRHVLGTCILVGPVWIWAQTIIWGDVRLLLWEYLYWIFLDNTLYFTLIITGINIFGHLLILNIWQQLDWMFCYSFSHGLINHDNTRPLNNRSYYMCIHFKHTCLGFFAMSYLQVAISMCWNWTVGIPVSKLT